MLWSRLRSWAHALLNRAGTESEMDAELRSHIAAYAEDLVRTGVPQQEAMRQARMEFGGIESVKEECRESRGVSFIETLLQDIRFGLRMLHKSPGFTVVAVLTLALGIGANTSLFSVVNGVLLNPLPYPHPDQVVIASNTSSTLPETWISYPDFLDWVRDNHSFSSLAAYESLVSFNLLGQGEPERISVTEISSGFFPTLGVTPVLGRNLSPAEDQLNGPPAVILSGGFWKTKFGGLADIVGKAINLNGTDYTVVGVLPENFYFCCENISFRLSDVYVPLGADKNPWMRDRKFHPGIYAIGRLQPGSRWPRRPTDGERSCEDKRYRRAIRSRMAVQPGGRGIHHLQFWHREVPSERGASLRACG
jgi:MacB-like periplasmic core domain